MKIAVYTIAKNEAQFVQRWADSCADADYRIVVDTGSTDGSDAEWLRLFKNVKNGPVVVHKEFTPWRFDVARNYALNLVPDDIDLCIALDMDEVLQPGWRDHLEQFLAANPGVTRPRYKYIWSWNPDGTEGLVYGGDKIHARHGYTWRHPVHEVITRTLNSPPEIQGWVPKLEIHHHPDPTKSRGQYFDLLKLAVEEDPDDDRNQFYLGREYFYHGDKDNAVRHLTYATMLSKWPPERAAAYRMMYKLTGNDVSLFRALREDPVRRENLVALAQHYYEQQNWAACHQFALNALSITVKPLDYLCETDAWGWLPYDLAAISAWHLGYRREAAAWGKEAVLLAPDDERLRTNLGWYTSG